MYYTFIIASDGLSSETAQNGMLLSKNFYPYWMVIILSNEQYTDKQGQYLAFIYAYTKLNGRPPAEADMQRFFKVAAPSVHRMVLELERKHLISRQPGQSRSIRLFLEPENLPILR